MTSTPAPRFPWRRLLLAAVLALLVVAAIVALIALTATGGGHSRPAHPG